MTNAHNPALAALRHHVTGAIERGEGEAITEMAVTHCRECGCDLTPQESCICSHCYRERESETF